jgi:hypothetical protein
MRTTTRTLLTSAAAAGALLLAAPAAVAHQCVNASKPQDAGVQLIVDVSTEEGSVSWVSAGLQKRIDRGLVDFETGAGFHGIVGLDFDGDGIVDVSTYIVGPNSEIPLPAQFNGATCKGIVNIGTFFAECMA